LVAEELVRRWSLRQQLIQHCKDFAKFAPRVGDLLLRQQLVALRQSQRALKHFVRMLNQPDERFAARCILGIEYGQVGLCRLAKDRPSWR
jgi:hypothetical protein